MTTGRSDEPSGEEGDWAHNFTLLLSQTSLTKKDIRKSTIPFLKGILNSLQDILRLNQHGCPLLGGSATTETENKEAYKEAEIAPTASAIEAFIKG
jgi:hypothetical protein